MSESSGSSFVCPMCGKECSSRDRLIHHFNTHLSYRKYNCGSCTNMFYTEEDREQHCRSQGHVHSFGMKVNQYNEMLVCQFVKDTDYLTFCDMDDLIIQRSKANLALDEAFSNNRNDVLKNTLKSVTEIENANVNGRDSRYSKKDDNKTRSRSLSKSRNSHSVRKNESNNIGTPSKELNHFRLGEKEVIDTESSNNSVSQSQSRIIVKNNEWVRSDENSISGLSPAVEILGDALRTCNEETKCILCKQMVLSDYVMRKDHVSRRHMPSGHNEEDYVEILENQMIDAFPGLVSSDIQCQIHNCKKTYKSHGSRRKHVARVHFSRELHCPFAKYSGCTFSSSAILRVNQHLKDDHGLKEGYRSIDNAAMKYDFGVDRTKHNASLDLMVRKAFPCPIPEFYKNRFRQSSGQKFEKLMSNLRENNRRFQDIPPAPLRRRSPSSSSSSSGGENSCRGIQMSETLNSSLTSESKKHTSTSEILNQTESYLRKGTNPVSLDTTAPNGLKVSPCSNSTNNSNICRKQECYESQSFPSHNSEHESSSTSASNTLRAVKVEDDTIDLMTDNKEDMESTSTRKDRAFEINYDYYEITNRQELGTCTPRRTLLTTPTTSTMHHRTLLTTPDSQVVSENCGHPNSRHQLTRKPDNYKLVSPKGSYKEKHIDGWNLFHRVNVGKNNTVAVDKRKKEKKRCNFYNQVDKREIKRKPPSMCSYNPYKTSSNQFSRTPSYCISKVKREMPSRSIAIINNKNIDQIYE